MGTGGRDYRSGPARYREARRLPALASRVNRMARERGEEVVARLLGEVAQSDELGKMRHSRQSASRQQRASSSISSSCPCSCGRCSERSSRSCTRRSGRTWRAALLSLLRRAGMTASLDLTDSLCGLGNSVAGLRILRLSARDPFATPTIKVHEQYEILPKRFPRLAN